MVQQIILILILTKNDLLMDNDNLVASMQNLQWANWRYFTGSLSRGSAPRVYEYSCLCHSHQGLASIYLHLTEYHAAPHSTKKESLVPFAHTAICGIAL